MLELNKDRILNSSPQKVLIREFENLKNDYTKMNALKYKELYENASLSFILENSRYIFAEPMKGYEFYKDVMEKAILPFNSIKAEEEKVEKYYTENAVSMSDKQRGMYELLLSDLHDKSRAFAECAYLYDNLVENTNEISYLYDEMYEYIRTNDDSYLDELQEFLEKDDSANVMDAIHLTAGIPSLSSALMEYVESAYNFEPKTPEEYQLSVYTSNVIHRMLRDSAIQESVMKIPNVNLRHLILGIGGVKSSEVVDSIVTETEKNYDPVYASAADSVNRIFEYEFYSEAFSEVNDEEKLNRLQCEKAVLEMDASFIRLDYLNSDDGEVERNPSVERMCIESTEVEKIPSDGTEQLVMLEKKISELDSDISVIEEKYFKADGSPSRVVAKSVGPKGADLMTAKKEKTDEKDEDSYDYGNIKSYTPVSNRKVSKDDSYELTDSEYDAIMKTEIDDRKTKDSASKKTAGGLTKIKMTDEIKSLVDTEITKIFNKYDKLRIHMIVNSDTYTISTVFITNAKAKQDSDLVDSGTISQTSLDNVYRKIADAVRKTPDFVSKGVEITGSIKKGNPTTESTDDFFEYGLSGNSFGLESHIFESEDDDNDDEDEGTTPRNKREKYPEVEKPQKRNIFQRIQNKALDNDVKAKRKTANAQRMLVDVKNAGKAVAKVPLNAAALIKKNVRSWDEMDDDKRKEYIIKPGVRKKYFRALKLCILHYGAFAINPVLNIVLFICQKIGKSKDVRIRNELVRELKAEIKVTEEKIEDAKSNGDNPQKYKLIRIKEKLEAELTRVGVNSTHI